MHELQASVVGVFNSNATVHLQFENAGCPGYCIHYYITTTNYYIALGRNCLSLLRETAHGTLYRVLPTLAQCLGCVHANRRAGLQTAAQGAREPWKPGSGATPATAGGDADAYSGQGEHDRQDIYQGRRATRGTRCRARGVASSLAHNTGSRGVPRPPPPPPKVPQALVCKQPPPPPRLPCSQTGNVLGYTREVRFDAMNSSLEGRRVMLLRIEGRCGLKAEANFSSEIHS